MEKETPIKLELEEQALATLRAKQQEQTGVSMVSGARGRIFCLTVIGQIEGHYLLDSTQKTTKYEHVLPQLVAVEQDPEIAGLLVLLNTVGGDVEAGLAIAELIAGMKKPTVSLVLGGGHSIGVPLAVAAKTSFIVPSASMTVHPVRTNGLTIHAPQTYTYFQKMQERIVHFVCTHARIEPRRFEELMLAPDEMSTDIGTILDGEGAVAEGLIDRIGGLSDALDCLYSMIPIDSKKEEKIAKND